MHAGATTNVCGLFPGCLCRLPWSGIKQLQQEHPVTWDDLKKKTGLWTGGQMMSALSKVVQDVLDTGDLGRLKHETTPMTDIAKLQMLKKFFGQPPADWPQFLAPVLYTRTACSAPSKYITLPSHLSFRLLPA